jgi:threonine dehydratase
MFSLDDFRQMRAALRDKVRLTPVVRSDWLSTRTGHDVYLKCENLQLTHSFKIRAAYGGLLPRLAAARERGAVTGSSGNFAQGIAYAGRALGVNVTVVMMERSAPNKVEAARRLGAEVVFCPNDFAVRLATVERLAREQGRVLVHSFDDEGTIYGNGTLALELIEQVPDADAVLVPTSGGGLLSATAAVLKQSGSRTRVWGVQTEAIPSLKVSLERGEPTAVANASTVADGLVATRPGRLNFELAKKYVDGVLLVSEEEIIAATVGLLERDKLVAEPSGAASAAALLRHLAGQPRQTVVCVLTGGNIELDRLLALARDARPQAAATRG